MNTCQWQRVFWTKNWLVEIDYTYQLFAPLVAQCHLSKTLGIRFGRWCRTMKYVMLHQKANIVKAKKNIDSVNDFESCGKLTA